MDKVKYVTWETCTDVAHIRLKLDQVIKEVVKVANKVQATSTAVKTSISEKFE